MGKTLITSNILWALIVEYRGATTFEDTTFTDFPIEGVSPDDVLCVTACSDKNEMCFYVMFKDDRDIIKLYFSSPSTLYRLNIFIRKHLTKITWE